MTSAQRFVALAFACMTACKGANPATEDAGSALRDSSAEGGNTDTDAAPPAQRDGGVAGGGAGTDAGAHGNASAGAAGNEPSGTSGSGGDAGAVDAGSNVTCTFDDAGTLDSESFIVPPQGGHFEFCAATGLVQLDAPPEIAGLKVTLSQAEVQRFAWPHPGFSAAMSDAIAVELSGPVAKPIRVRLPNGALLAFMFQADTTVPVPLRITEDHNALELVRAGVIGVLANERACEATPNAPFTNGWVDSPNSGYCSCCGERSTWRHFECGSYPYCHEIVSWCCVYPGDSRVGCSIADTVIYNNFVRSSPSEAYPYCDGVGDTPYLFASTPASLIASYQDQNMTLTGNNLSSLGSMFAGESSGDLSRSIDIRRRTWISSTQVDVTVTGRSLDAAGEIWFLYENPDSGTYLDWGRKQSNRLHIEVAAPAVSCPLPTVFMDLPNGCECSVDFDPGGGLHTYAMTCTTTECACKRDGVVVTTAPRINACNNERTTVEQWKSSCLSTAAFCP